MSAFGTGFNRYLSQYGGTLTDPREREAFAKAKAIADQNARTARLTNPSGALAGGDAWHSMGQFHEVRQAMERLQGNRYGVGAISGGADLNERPLVGMGSTRQVNAPRQAGFAGGGGFAPGGGVEMPQYDPTESASDHSDRLERQRIGLEMLRRQLEAADLQNRALRDSVTRAEAEPFAGSQAEVDRQTGGIRRAQGLADEGLDLAARGTARRFFEPDAMRMRSIQQREAVDRASASAATAGASRERVAGIQSATQRAIAEGRKPTAMDFMSDFMGNASDLYGTDPRTGKAMLPDDAAALLQEFITGARGRLAAQPTTGPVPTAPPGRMGGPGPAQPAPTPAPASSGPDAAFIARAKAAGYSDAEIQQFLAQGR